MSQQTQPDHFPVVCLNGRFVPAACATVSVFDRSFLLGDGAFETTCIMEGCPLNWPAHWRRLCVTARWLGIRLPLTSREALAVIAGLLQRNRTRNAILRLHLSRGCGRRGYSPIGANAPIWVMTLHSAAKMIAGEPGSTRLGICPFVLSATDQLVRHKSASRLLNVLAKADAEARGFDDALFLDSRGRILEAISSSFFWIQKNRVFTAPLALGLLPGLTRSEIMRHCVRLHISVAERRAPLAEARQADAAFLSVGTDGIKTVRHFAGRDFADHPLIRELHVALTTSWQRQAARFATRFDGRCKNGRCRTLRNLDPAEIGPV